MKHTERDFRRWLISLQVLLTLFMFVLLGAGWSYAHRIQSLEADIARFPSAAYEARLHKQIGEAYTPMMHGQVIETAQTTEKGLVFLSYSAKSYANWTFGMAGVGMLICLFSLVLVVRNVRNHEH